ncbi:MAG: prolipoprotein diacylglyceryl transferase [Paracoccaceae bacterium]
MGRHLVFDLLAVALAFCATAAMWFWRLKERPHPARNAAEGYATALAAGVMLGSYCLGTANLWLSGMPIIGRSILGALAGGIVSVELWKHARGIRESTGLLFVPTFTVLVMVGRIGCLLSGLEDNTYGLPTDLPWGWDFGDGISRHPVAAYESISMALWFVVVLVTFGRRSPFFMANGFYLTTGYYAAQRFVGEFFKPYAPVLGPFNLFHIASMMLLLYSVAMIRKARAT